LSAATQHAAHQKRGATGRNQGETENDDALCVHEGPLLLDANSPRNPLEID
jgi:hypothetical protein